ncbi:putative lipid-transfer protein DIR1 [Neltuma alba]|uniref:putative lipid-transfer protein DIR1 n=1 Tax=Neltuma alba TaxID=207710 RepID=UPI0010A3EC38|nr:putative lipid-transfer protein DIR1 [Prosopis alba]
MNNILFLVLVILGLINHSEVYGAGVCGISSPEREAWKLAPCVTAAMDENAPVSERCCNQIKRLGQKIACLCAVVLSSTAKIVGVKPEIAVTIPKRCSIADRPVGYKCGGLRCFIAIYSFLYEISNHLSVIYGNTDH